MVALAACLQVRADSAPVNINSCYLLYRDQTNRRWTETIVGPLYITFANQTSQDVEAVHFAVAYKNKNAVLYATGTISPGQTITRQYGDFNSYQWPYLPKTQPTCAVTYVKFADGTIWRQPVS